MAGNDGFLYPFPIDSVIDDERFDLLVGLDTEYDAIDKKETVVLDRVGLAELAKDIAALVYCTRFSFTLA